MTDETRERVLRVSAELNYRPNRMASALRREKIPHVGFLGDTVATTPFAGEMLRGAQDAAVARAYSMILASSGADPQLEAREIGLLRSFPVDGLIVGRMFHQYVDLDVDTIGMPTVWVNARARDDSVPALVPDEEQNWRGRHTGVLDAGHRVGGAPDDHRRPGCARDGRVVGYRTRSLAGRTRAHRVRERGDHAERARGGAAASARRGSTHGHGVLQRPDGDGRVPGCAAAGNARSATTSRSSAWTTSDYRRRHLTRHSRTVALPHYEMGKRAMDDAAGHGWAGCRDGGTTDEVECPLVRRGSVAAAPR